MADTIPPTDAPAATDAAPPEQDKKKGPGIAGLAAAAAAGTAGATLTAGALHEKAIEWNHAEAAKVGNKITEAENNRTEAQRVAVEAYQTKDPRATRDRLNKIEKRAAKPFDNKLRGLLTQDGKLTAALEKLDAVENEGFLKKAGAVFSHGGGKAAGSAVLLGATIAVPVAFLVKEARNHGSHADRVAASQQTDASPGASR